MAGNRDLIRKLAESPSVAAGTRKVAERLKQRAEQIDPKSDFTITDGHLVVNGFRRRVSIVANESPDAGRVEFGRQSGRDGSDGRGGLRPLGRAARSVGG